MANKKSSKKDLRRTAKRRVRNTATKSALKTYVKKVRTAVTTGETAPTQTALTLAIKALDKASQRGVIHKNQAARRKSRIAKAANKVLNGDGVAPVAAAPAPKAPKAKAAPKAAPKAAAAK